MKIIAPIVCLAIGLQGLAGAEEAMKLKVDDTVLAVVWVFAVLRRRSAW